MINGFGFFRIYHSLHLHFTSNFDALKYRNRSKSISVQIYEDRKEKGRFDSFADKLQSEKTAFHFCIANFTHNHERWFYKDYSEAESIYITWKAYFDSFSYNFKREYEYLTKVMNERNIKFSDMLVPTTSGNNPPLLQLLLHGKITPEFVCTLDTKFTFIDNWHNLMGNDPYLEKIVFKLKKYAPLCSIITNNFRGKSESK